MRAWRIKSGAVYLRGGQTIHFCGAKEFRKTWPHHRVSSKTLGIVEYLLDRITLVQDQRMLQPSKTKFDATEDLFTAKGGNMSVKEHPGSNTARNLVHYLHHGRILK